MKPSITELNSTATSRLSKFNLPVNARCLGIAILCLVLLAIQNLRAEDAVPAHTNKWTTTAAAGLTLTSGNSHSVMATANILTETKWPQNELRFGADAAYGKNDGKKSADSLHGFGQYNRLFSERFYGYARVDALHDAIADIGYRITLSPGAGYYFIKDKQTSLSAEAGPGIIFERQGTNDNTYLTLRVAERFERKLNDRVRVWQSLEWLPQVDDFSNWILNGELGLETKMTAKASLRVFAQDAYDNQPAPGRQKNDLKLVTAIAYTF